MIIWSPHNFSSFESIGNQIKSWFGSEQDPPQTKTDKFQHGRAPRYEVAGGYDDMTYDDETEDELERSEDEDEEEPGL